MMFAPKEYFLCKSCGFARSEVCPTCMLEIFPPGFTKTTKFMKDLQEEYTKRYQESFIEDR